MYFYCLIGKVRENVQSLLDSLTELSKLLYQTAESRSPKQVLRLHNTAFVHAMLCKEVIGQPEILTRRKFYGRYWHSLTAHAAKQNRIISGRSTNTEEEERHFNSLQGITKLTNRRPGDIITPSLVRLQAEHQMTRTRQVNAVRAQESEISKYFKALPPFPNTIIPHRYIVRNPREYQVHLESISDFLCCGEGVWWKHVVSGVEFLDGPQEPNFRPEGPSLHHFRSSNLKLEEQHLKQCWDMCLADETIKIPHRVIRRYGDNGDCIQVIHTNFLDDDGDNNDDEEGDVVEEGNEEDVEEDETDQVQQEVNDTEEQVESVELIEEQNEALLLDDKELSGFSYEKCDEGNAETTNVPSLTILSENQSPSTSCTSNQSKSDCQKSSPKIDTKLGKNIARILGETEDVYQLDQARRNLKSHPTSDFYRNKYNNLLAQMQTKVLAQHSLLKKEHSTWEREYCLKNDFHEPNLSDVKKDKKQYAVYKNIILCQELLKYWNITVHL